MWWVYALGSYCVIGILIAMATIRADKSANIEKGIAIAMSSIIAWGPVFVIGILVSAFRRR